MATLLSMLDQSWGPFKFHMALLMSFPNILLLLQRWITNISLFHLYSAHLQAEISLNSMLNHEGPSRNPQEKCPTFIHPTWSRLPCRLHMVSAQVSINISPDNKPIVLCRVLAIRQTDDAHPTFGLSDTLIRAQQGGSKGCLVTQRKFWILRSTAALCLTSHSRVWSAGFA